MNIFVTDPCPKKSAEALDDRRLTKMVLETAQLLSTWLHLSEPSGWEQVGIYKPTHVKHPCTLWLLDSPSNVKWLTRHGDALAQEFLRRRGKTHASATIIQRVQNYSYSMSEVSDEVEYFCDVAGHAWKDSKNSPAISETSLPNVCLKYRSCLLRKWSEDRRKGRDPKWDGRDTPPEWVECIYG